MTVDTHMEYFFHVVSNRLFPPRHGFVFAMPVQLFLTTVYLRRNYLFQMAFRKVEDTQFLYQTEFAASPKRFREILSEKSVQNIQWTTRMELIESLLEPYQLQKTWFSDEVHFYGISSEYIIHVDLSWALNITVSSDNHIVFHVRQIYKPADFLPLSVSKTTRFLTNG